MSERKPQGCACTHEAGDSPCPVHGMNEPEPAKRSAAWRFCVCGAPSTTPDGICAACEKRIGELKAKMEGPDTGCAEDRPCCNAALRWVHTSHCQILTLSADRKALRARVRELEAALATLAPACPGCEGTGSVFLGVGGGPCGVCGGTGKAKAGWR